MARQGRDSLAVRESAVRRVLEQETRLQRISFVAFWVVAALLASRALSSASQEGDSLQLAAALHDRGEFKQAAEVASRAVEQAVDSAARAKALDQLGLSLLARGKSKLYAEAVRVLQRAVEEDPDFEAARLHLGEALLFQENETAGRHLLEELVSEGASAAAVARATALLRNPANVEYPSLPALRLVTLDGRVVHSRDLIGKVVLFDFWATWCPPCIAALPDLRRLHSFAKDRPIEIVSVSVDEDSDKLRRFVSENDMSWAVVHDETGELRSYFGVQGYPTYILIDPDGFLVASAMGHEQSLGDAADRLILKAKSMAKKLDRSAR